MKSSKIEVSYRGLEVSQAFHNGVHQCFHFFLPIMYSFEGLRLLPSRNSLGSWAFPSSCKACHIEIHAGSSNAGCWCRCSRCNSPDVFSEFTIVYLIYGSRTVASPTRYTQTWSDMWARVCWNLRMMWNRSLPSSFTMFYVQNHVYTSSQNHVNNP